METEVEYAQRLADELEAEILRVGAGKVAAFFAETGELPGMRREATRSLLCPDTSRGSRCWKPCRRAGLLQKDSRGKSVAEMQLLLELTTGPPPGLRQVWSTPGSG